MYDEDPLKRHSSLTWLQQSSHIISKVLQPVFKDMYKILKTIIMNEEREFCVFLFSQKEHYLNVLLARLFQDLGRFSPTKDSGLKGSGVSGTGTSTLAKSSSLINTNTS
jgi:hypothetical protein